MSKKDEIKRLWTEAFGDPREYVEMYFDRVYRDTDAMTLVSDDGRIVTSLLLQPYGFNFHGLDATVSYVSGAATRRNMRGRGLMTALMIDALDASRRRGDILTLLIPASEYLYGYYSRFGFATAAYTDVMRYTALHTFAPPEDETAEQFTPVDDLFTPAVYEAFAAMESESGEATVLHSHRDFLNILDDLHLDGGFCDAVADESGRVDAIAFARPAPDGSDNIRVDEVLSRSPQARLAALRQLRARWPGRPFAVLAPVVDDGRRLTPRGMARIVDVERILGLLAEANPALKLTLRVADQLIPENNGIFRIASGTMIRLEKEASSGTRQLDFDVSVVTLTQMLFSSEAIGSALGFPSRRLRMALMLD